MIVDLEALDIAESIKRNGINLVKSVLLIKTDVNSKSLLLIYKFKCLNLVVLKLLLVLKK